MYVCVYSSASGRIIGAKDHASIQINIADVSNVEMKELSGFSTETPSSNLCCLRPGVLSDWKRML